MNTGEFIAYCNKLEKIIKSTDFNTCFICDLADEYRLNVEIKILEPGTVEIKLSSEDMCSKLRCGIIDEFTSKIEHEKPLGIAINWVIEDPCWPEKLEITHSCTLEFPNGDIVDIPPPDAEKWICVSTKINDWPYIHFDEHERTIGRVAHESGTLVYKEYFERMCKENPLILKESKWLKRTHTTINETEERYAELEKFPLLNGLDK